MNILNKYYAKGRVVSIHEIRNGQAITIASPVFATRKRDNEIKTIAIEAYPNIYVVDGSEALEIFNKEQIKVGDFVKVEGRFRSFIDSNHPEALTDIEATSIKRDISRLDSAYFIKGREYSTPENAGFVSGKITEIHLSVNDSNNKPLVVQIDVSENNKRNVVRALCYGPIKAKILREVHIGDEIKTFGIIQTPDKKNIKDRNVMFYHNFIISDYVISNEKEIMEKMAI